jgi:Protein of unknown function (DUF1566)
MQLNYKRIAYILVAVVMALLMTIGVLAGSLNSPSAPDDPASQMYTLEDIYNRVNSGITTTKMTAFTEPANGPGTVTMYTLDEIYNLAGERNLVPKTGSASCFDDTQEINCAGTGQDGEYQVGVDFPSPRFIDNGNGTVTDNFTQLIWLQDVACIALVGTFTTTLTIANNLQDGQCGLTDSSSPGDWHLPNIKELMSITYYGKPSTLVLSFLPPGAPFVASHLVYGSIPRHWSSTPSEVGYAWVKDRRDFDNVTMNSPGFGWAVRGGQ